MNDACSKASREVFDIHPAVSAAFGGLESREPLTDPQIDGIARGLLVQLSLDEKISMPLAVEVIDVLFAADVHVNPLTVTAVAVGALLLPLGIGLVSGRFFPTARRWVPVTQQASGRLLLICLIGSQSWAGLA